MKQNLLIVSYDYNLSKEVAKILANVFSMRIFDQRELFEFDHLPLTFTEVIDRNGYDYVLKKMKSIIKMELDFDDAVFVADMCFAENCEDIFYKIQLSNFVVFLYKNTTFELEELRNKEYSSGFEKDFYVVDEEKHECRKSKLQKLCSDIKLDVTNLTYEEITNKIIDEIKQYYSMN